jgi:hypothetical protein
MQWNRALEAFDWIARVHFAVTLLSAGLTVTAGLAAYFEGWDWLSIIFAMTGTFAGVAIIYIAFCFFWDRRNGSQRKTNSPPTEPSSPLFPADILEAVPDLRISDEPTVIVLFETAERDRLLPLLELGKLSSWARPMSPGEPPLTSLVGKVWSTHYFYSLPKHGPGTKTQSFLKTKNGQQTAYYDVHLNRFQIEKIWPSVPVLRPLWEAVAYISKQIGDNDLKERFPKACREMRQAALDGKIKIRGTKSAQLMGAGASYSEMQTDVPAEYWETADIGALATSEEGDDMFPHTFPHQFSDGRFGEQIFLYAKLCVNWREITRLWPPKRE